jgi:hypothetical protein
VGDLDLSALPDLPQRGTIALLAPRLWHDARVAAVWIGGSLARGVGDAYSDIDLRVAVAPADLDGWKTPDFAALLGDLALDRQFISLGDDVFIHHLILANGDILDFLVQSVERRPPAEPILILGCRSATLAERLAAASRPEEVDSKPASAEAVRELVTAFWINSHKHRKVLHRRLEPMFPAGVYAAWTMLMRLWYIEATGNDVRPYHFSGIHGLTELVRAVGGVAGADALAIFGAPIRTPAEIWEAVTRQHEAAAHAGRLLADRFGFAYPAALEEMVRASWSAFRCAYVGADGTSHEDGA